jgi:serine O-acetyltransferase
MDLDIKTDLYRYYPEPYSFKSLLKGLRAQGFRYMFFRRLYYLCKRNPIYRFFLKLILHHYTIKYGFQIGGTIGKGFYIGHFGTIIVNENVKIGEYCNISSGVVIGASRRGEQAGTPILGNRVWIGVNSVIVGKIVIGSDVLIAPGAYVNFDVPDHSIVIGNPGRIIVSENATQGYINNTL